MVVAPGFIDSHAHVEQLDRRPLAESFLRHRAPTPAELERMASMVDKAMREGAVGLSSGLCYVPANYATTEEVSALVKVAAKQGGIYSAHIRDEGADVELTDGREAWTRLASPVRGGC